MALGEWKRAQMAVISALESDQWKRAQTVGSLHQWKRNRNQCAVMVSELLQIAKKLQTSTTRWLVQWLACELAFCGALGAPTPGPKV